MKTNKSLVWSKITFYSVISRAVNVAMRWVYQEPSHSVIFALTYLSLYPAKVGRCARSLSSFSTLLTIMSLINLIFRQLQYKRSIHPLNSTIIAYVFQYKKHFLFRNFYDVGLMSYYLYIFNPIKNGFCESFSVRILVFVRSKVQLRQIHYTDF